MINNIIKIQRNKKILVITIIALLITIGIFIWNNEKGTNKQIPKKATYAMNYSKGCEEYRQGTSIHKSKFKVFC